MGPASQKLMGYELLVLKPRVFVVNHFFSKYVIQAVCMLSVQLSAGELLVNVARKIPAVWRLQCIGANRMIISNKAVRYVPHCDYYFEGNELGNQ